MSDYLRLTYNLLVNLGGVSSPELFPAEMIADKPQHHSKPIAYKTGEIKFEPQAFSFFQGALSESFIIGHIPQDGKASLPVIYSTLASGLLTRDNGVMRPLFEPAIREIVLVPEAMGDFEVLITEYVESGLDVERYSRGDNTYADLRKSSANKVLSSLADLKEQVFLAFNESLDDEKYLVMVDGSLKPTEKVLQAGNWVGVYSNPGLNPAEEEVSLKLDEDEIGPPFDMEKNGYFWHLRMFSDYRKDPSWGLIKVENALMNGDDMKSKIETISAGILNEKFPIHPLADKEDGRLYPLITSRVFLRTQITDDRSIMKYF